MGGAGRRWQLDAIPRVHLPNEVQLASAQSHDLPGGQPLAAPREPPVTIPQGADSALVSSLRVFVAQRVVFGLQPLASYDAPAWTGVA